MANFEIIRDLLAERGMTVRELAKRIDMRDSSIHHAIAVGSTNTTTIENIARVLEVPVGIFFDDLPEDPSQDPTRIEELERENNHLRELLEEKERTIRILMK